MRWFRLQRRPAGWVALFALAVQLVLSFGHVHGLTPDAPAGIAAAATGSTAPPQPADGRHHDDDYCAICAVIAMLSGAQTATAPVLPTFIALVSCEIASTTEAARVNFERAAFRSRAPPQA